MAKSAFQHKVEELEQRFDTLQRFAVANPEQARLSPSGVLVGLHRSLRELESAVASPTADAGAPSFASATGADESSASSHLNLRERELADRSDVLVRLMDRGDRCGWTNRAWRERTGRDTPQQVGSGWLDDVHPDDRERCASACRDAFASSVPRTLEYRLRSASGEHGWVLEIVTPREGRSGLVCTVVDIGARKQAEIQLALREEIARALAASAKIEDAYVAVVRILCERTGWDVGELWSVGSNGCALHCEHRWPASRTGADVDASAAAAPAPEAVSPFDAGTAGASLVHGSSEQRLAMSAMFCVPVCAHGEVRAQLRFYARDVRPRDAGVAELLSSASVQLGQDVERRRCEDERRDAEACRDVFLDASFDGWITIDQSTQVVELNKAAETIFGYRRDEALGRDLVDLLVPSRMRRQALKALDRYRAGEDEGSRARRFDTFAMKKDGSEFPVEVGVAPLHPPQRSPLALHVRDTSARASAEQEIRLHRERQRSLMADLLLAEELERRRLAVDLHDGLTQTIALAQMKLSAVRLAIDGTHAAALDEVQGLIEQANGAARSISFELSPPVLHDLGLEPAVQWLVENIQGRYDLEVTLEDDGVSKPTDEKTRVILFRAIRELLINAAKHSHARHTKVSLAREGDRIVVVVRDDGVGMDPELQNAKGFGLFSIHERLSHVGGTMHIDSSAGRGATVTLNAPLAAEASKKVQETP